MHDTTTTHQERMLELDELSCVVTHCGGHAGYMIRGEDGRVSEYPSGRPRRACGEHIMRFM